MAWSEALTRLRDALATIYGSKEEARRVAQEAGLNPAYIRLEGEAIQIWHAILAEAELQNRTTRLIAVAQIQYATYEALAAAAQGYQQWVAAGRPVAEPPQWPQSASLPAALDRSRLHNLLTTRFNLEELKTLCFDMGIPYENLGGEGLSGKARELVAYCERHGRTDELTGQLQRQVSGLDRGLRPAAPPAVSQPSTTSYSGTVTGSGALAQGPGANAVGAGGVQIGGNAQGNQIVTGNNNTVGGRDVQTGGIRARRIKAENVVSGVQMQGGDADTAAALASLAKSILRGGIQADDIEARSVVDGLQYIQDPAKATPDDLRREVEALRAQIAAARQGQQLNDAQMPDAEEAEDILTTVEEELKKPTPRGSKVKRYLADATEILTKGADTAEAAEKVGGYLVKLAPVAAALFQVAQRLFGG